VLEGVWGEGLLAEPKGASVGHAVVVPDAGQQPEQMIGLADGITTESQLARRLADRGLTVVIPALVSRERLVPEAMRVPREARERLARTQQTYREWLYRQAYHMGRHVIGYEVHKVLAAVEWLHKQAGDAGAVGVAGYGEGGLIAFHAAAASARIDAVLVSGYFDSREAVWREPIDRNVWAQLVEFGDAELATLVAPGGLVVEYSKPPQWHDAKGRIETPPFERVRDEFARIDRLIPAALQRRVFVHGAGGRPVAPGSNDALREFVGMLGAEANGFLDGRGATPWRDRAPEVDAGARNLRQVRQIQTHVQCLVRRSDRERERFFLEPLLPRLVTSAWTAAPDEPIESAQPLIERSQRYRDHFRAEVIGRFDEPLLPLRPRTRKRYETATWTGYDVVLDVHRHLFAWGGLLVPKEIRPGERRPVVVAQHGRARLPKHLIDADIEAYSNFAAQLAERGFVVFVPHNLYRGEERYRWLDRKANTVKASLYSFIIAQHEQILRWLKTLPFVDQQRIGLYGLSFGGQTALRVPAVLDGYALSICSGIFNQWTRKVASSEVPNSFLYTKEWEVPQFNMGNTFDHAEMVYLIFPRPFMVERGHYDRVGQDRWVAYEYAKVRRLYALAGKPERTAITFFRGGHSIRGAASFDFLHKHLRWPPPLEQSSEQITPGPSED
jgi:dienelactone hydrolase